MDGPFKLSAYDATDNGATVVPNKAYSGPVKPSIDKLVMAPFTTDTAEFNVLAAGGGKINIGYVPPQNLPKYSGKPWCGAAGPCVGANNAQLAPNYKLAPVLGWSVNYFAMNYTNPTSGPIFKQLYIRQALQSLMNQTLWIQLYQSGYGSPTYGPVPVNPPTKDVHLTGGLQPVPLQPVTREVAAVFARLDGGPRWTDHLREAGNRRQRVRGRDPEGRGAELPVPVLQRGCVVRQPDQGARLDLGAGRREADARGQGLR